MPKKRILPESTLQEIGDFMQKQTQVSKTLIERELKLLRSKGESQPKSETGKSEPSADDLARLRREAQIERMKQRPAPFQSGHRTGMFVGNLPLDDKDIKFIDAEKAKELRKQFPASDGTEKGRKKS